MAKKKKEEVEIVENIQNESLDSLMSDRYGVYAKYVIQDRAIPDARDGLKPVQRRIIYSMYEAGNTIDKPTRKCAKIVGDVMGKYHPHGDSSIYGALARMSQNWVMNMPLIDFQGNNGGIDGDEPAAYRYTEARLNDFAMNLVRDIKKDTVDMTLNFDDTEEEPVVLPARFPNLFVNGSEGIAVAIATEIPPHNLKEMCEAAIYRIQHPTCTISQLLEIVKGPDFPTGGTIYKTEELEEIYKTGRGRAIITSKVTIDTSDKNENQLIVSEIPYKVNKRMLVSSIERIIKSKEIDGILSVIDASAGEEIKIIISLKKEANPSVILTYLLNKTQLRVNYTANIVAIADKHPRTLNLSAYLDVYIQHQIDVITRRTNYDLKVSRKRLHIVEGLILAINNIDEVIRIIRKSKDKADSKEKLKERFGLSEEQAEAIVTMQLYRLSNTDVQVYLDERDSLKALIAELESILADDKKLKKVIIKDLKEIADKFGVERKTKVEEKQEEQTIDRRDLVAKEDVWVAISREGYAKKSSIKSYNSSDGALPGLKEGDCLVLQALVNTMDYILAFTDKGNYLFIEVHQIQDGKWKDEGKHINSFITLPIDENIVKCIVVKDFDKDVCIGLVTKKGMIKKTKLKDFYPSRNNKPITCIKVTGGDKLADVSVLNGNSNLAVIAANGKATYFNENELTEYGLKAVGVKAISTLKGTYVNNLISFRSDEKGKVMMVTDKGAIRIFDLTKLELTKRLGATQKVFDSFKSDVHTLVYTEKIGNRKDPLTLHALLNDKSVMDITVEDFLITPEKMCKGVVKLKSKQLISYIYSPGVQVIDKDTIVEVSKDAPKARDPFMSQAVMDDEEGESDFEQISIFDEMGD